MSQALLKKNLEDQRVYQNIGLGKVMLATTGVLGNEPSNMEEKAVNERSEGLSQVTSKEPYKSHVLLLALKEPYKSR